MVSHATTIGTRISVGYRTCYTVERMNYSGQYSGGYSIVRSVLIAVKGRPGSRRRSTRGRSKSSVALTLFLRRIGGIYPLRINVDWFRKVINFTLVPLVAYSADQLGYTLLPIDSDRHGLVVITK